MAGVNKVTLLGHLGRDPEVRQTQDGARIVNFPLAMSESWKDKNTGERREKTEWAKIVIFNEALGRVAECYLRKGSKVYLEGALQTRKWEKDGTTHYTTEVVLQRFRGEMVLLDSKPQSGGGGETEPHSADARSELNDEIPFVTRWGVR